MYTYIFQHSSSISMESKSKTIVEMVKMEVNNEMYIMANHGKSMHRARELLAQKHMLMMKHVEYNNIVVNTTSLQRKRVHILGNVDCMG